MKKKITLSEKKQKRAESGQSAVFKGTGLFYNASLQREYVAILKKNYDVMIKDVESRVIKLFESETAEEFYAQDASIASQARILTNELINKYKRIFSRKAPLIAERMIKKSDKLSRVNLQTSLKTLSGGVTIKTNVLTTPLKTIVTASVAENVALIKSIPQDYLVRVQKLVLRSITVGEGVKTLIPALKKYKGITDRHAKNLALDQTRKVYNSFNAGRMQKVGIKKFEWLHSGGGQKPRKEHIAMNGKIFSFDELPVIVPKTGERGIPGQAINCGCTMRPVLEINEN